MHRKKTEQERRKGVSRDVCFWGDDVAVLALNLPLVQQDEWNEYKEPEGCRVVAGGHRPAGMAS